MLGMFWIALGGSVQAAQFGYFSYTDSGTFITITDHGSRITPMSMVGWSSRQ